MLFTFLDDIVAIAATALVVGVAVLLLFVIYKLIFNK